MAQSKKSSHSSAFQDALKGCYGSQVKPSEMKQWLIENILDNIGRKTRISLNIMGPPGIGKTDIVKSLENEPIEWNGRHYDGFKVIDIPLAQIEEMGDVLGYPVEEIKMIAKDGTEK